MPTPVAFVHTSHAAIPALVQFYARQAPHLDVNHLLDDRILRLLGQSRYPEAQDRLLDLARASVLGHNARAVLVTCSSVTPEMTAALERELAVPVLKIDTPLAETAVRTGRRIGIVATFHGTVQPTTRLLEWAARQAQREVALFHRLLPDAYEALLSGDAERHDRIVLEAMDSMATEADVLVLAQVSHARLLPHVGRFPVPVLSSLPLSLNALNAALAQQKVPDSTPVPSVGRD
jgi:glutamate racemase